MGLRNSLLQRWRLVASVFFIALLLLGWQFFLGPRSTPSTGITWNDILLFVTYCGLALVVISLLLWELLLRYLEPENFDHRKDFLDLFIKIVGGTTLLISLFTTWKSIRDAQQQLEQNKQQLERSNELSRLSLEATQATLDATRKQQIEERFYKAIEKLDSPDAGIRTGAIYSLGKIAEQSDDHYWLVMQVLSGFVRERHHWNPKAKPVRPALPCPSDVQAVFTVVGKRRNRWNGSDSQDGEPARLDFSYADLRGLILREDSRGGYHLEGLRLWGANLAESEFLGVALDDVAFDEANLKGTSFTGSSLNGAAFNDAIFDERTNFMRTEATLKIGNIVNAKDYMKAVYPMSIREQLATYEKEGEGQ